MQVAQSWVRPPDIVISDLKLGDGRSGLDVLNALARHYGSASHPPFARLLITGETKSDRLPEISAAKIPVLYKPVSPNQLRAALVATLAPKLPALTVPLPRPLQPRSPGQPAARRGPAP